MDLLSIILVIVYLMVTGYLGYLGYRQTKTAADYLVAGRSANPIVMALSYGATFISTSAIVGFGGAAANLGMGVLWLTVLNISVGIFVAFAIQNLLGFIIAIVAGMIVGAVAVIAAKQFLGNKHVIIRMPPGGSDDLGVRRRAETQVVAIEFNASSPTVGETLVTDDLSLHAFSNP